MPVFQGEPTVKGFYPLKYNDFRFTKSAVPLRDTGLPGAGSLVTLWVGCVAGALSDYEYVEKLAKAGFEQIGIEPTRVYNINDAREFLSGRGINVNEFARQLEGKFISAFVRANKPTAGCCSSSGCK